MTPTASPLTPPRNASVKFGEYERLATAVTDLDPERLAQAIARAMGRVEGDMDLDDRDEWYASPREMADSILVSLVSLAAEP